MTPSQQQLVRDVIEMTGGEPPGWSKSDSPTLEPTTPRDLYLIGVIGGKDVGKSSLINAVLGQDIAAVSNHGEGTARALAYVHEADAAAANDILENNSPGAFDLVHHNIEDARGRVLLDLPDVDSVWDAHADLTRRLLRVMLFPVWVQSIEKYADQTPLTLLARVAEGNAPQNFAFVLTKADQLAARHGRGAVEELKSDFAQRVARACKLADPPTVHAIDGLTAAGFDLQKLRAALLEKRNARTLESARHLADQQQAKTLGGWLAQQQIAQRLAAAERSLEDAEAMLGTRVIEPLLERIARRPPPPSLVEPAVRARIAHWPIVAAIDAVAAPVLSALRAKSEPWSDASLGGMRIAQHVQGVFSELSQRQPQLLDLYDKNKFWETESAARAADALEQRFADVAADQQADLREQTSRPSILVSALAFILTIGAALWFPIVQPILEIVLQQNIQHFTSAALLLIVQIVGATYLIRSVGFLAIYFVALWIWLRWRITRRLERRLTRGGQSAGAATVLAEWEGRMLSPLRRQVERLKSLSDRIDAIQQPTRPARIASDVSKSQRTALAAKAFN